MSQLNDRISEAVSYFRGLGYSLVQSLGIVGNLQYESGLDPNNRRGDNGTAWGIGQWRGARQSGMGTTFEEQLAHVADELNSGYGGAQLRQTTTVADATRVFGTLFERPHDLSASLTQRIALANSAGNSVGNGSGITAQGSGTANGYGLNIFGYNFGDQVDPNSPQTNPLSPNYGGGPSALTSMFSSVFNAVIGARFVAVFIGIVLVGLAVAAFVLTSDNAPSIGKAIPNA